MIHFSELFNVFIMFFKIISSSDRSQSMLDEVSLENIPTPPTVEQLPRRLRFEVGQEPEDFLTSEEVSGLQASTLALLRLQLDSLIRHTVTAIIPDDFI